MGDGFISDIADMIEYDCLYMGDGLCLCLELMFYSGTHANSYKPIFYMHLFSLLFVYSSTKFSNIMYV